MHLELSSDDLKPIVAEVVREVLAQADTATTRLDDRRLGFTEQQAAQALGIPQHRLRDARLRREVRAKKIGKGYVYSRDSLLKFLAETD